jgi:dipeptidyl-peptidase-4
MDRQLFAVNFNGKNLKQISHKRGWHDVQFNADNTCYLDNYSNINTPPVFTINDNKGNMVRLLQDNNTLKKVMSEYELSKAHFLKIPNDAGVFFERMDLKASSFRFH